MGPNRSGWGAPKGAVEGVFIMAGRLASGDGPTITSHVIAGEVARREFSGCPANRGGHHDRTIRPLVVADLAILEYLGLRRLGAGF
jgi:hypothetical protein